MSVGIRSSCSIVLLLGMLYVRLERGGKRGRGEGVKVGVREVVRHFPSCNQVALTRLVLFFTSPHVQTGAVFEEKRFVGKTKKKKHKKESSDSDSEDESSKKKKKKKTKKKKKKEVSESESESESSDSEPERRKKSKSKVCGSVLVVIGRYRVR